MFTFFNIDVSFFMILILQSVLGDESCRVPLGIKTSALPPDDRFIIDINPPVDHYVPEESYTVVLKSTDGKAKFIGFSIWLTGNTAENPDNPRKPKYFLAGRLLPDDSLTKFGDRDCPNNTVIQTNLVPKSLVQAKWKAPPKDQGCVTIHAMVAIRNDMYYSGLTRRVCEDVRKLEDMPPDENPNCSVCEEARYKMIFEGLWSYNTHRPLYPLSNTSSASFSDIVGASHNKNFNIFIIDKEASEGVKTLAEQGNTTVLELDMQEKIGNSVRSIIKATRPRTTNAATSAIFRVNQKYHLVSIVTAILPSPDWFLGAANLELCDARNPNTWSPKITYNLYPLDAGTDKGTDFISPNDNLMPPQAIGNVRFQNPSKENKPFAKLHFELIRTFKLTPYCLTNKTETSGEDEGEGDTDKPKEDEENTENEDEESSVKTTVSSTSEASLVTDPESSAECPMSAWSDWDECVGSCEDGKRRGQHKRERYHLVNNHPVEYGDDEEYEKVPETCREIEEFNFELCEEDCEETSTAEPETQQRVAPGKSWWFK
ncbi:spondin-2-like [Leguminivora glycinivorella]|uniref:spondin-2-like n=1 Tax=Leguminivora glycinivorella TaxID=1035111 RepID=UPI00201033C9|nr:spondin-2-like [Leguminivora glycinivorella]